ncbi:MAG: 1,4-alpha-glucan-branching enzyme [Desulfobacteraceae bacterium]|nr:alpha amylase C-terminal domain-containing protein [Desulfobacteraceae bacterium]MBC2755971.1 1,4-alpha-glucan-branching enzyme [Desulfobacteraceae bacterium]
MTNTISNSDKTKHLAEIRTQNDPYLRPYKKIITRRLQKINETEQRLTQNKMSLVDFAAGHEFFGLHFNGNEWIFREWAPNANAVYIIGEMTHWREIPEYRLRKVSPGGAWEINLPADALHHQALYRLRIHWPGGTGDRIPAYARRVVQDPHSGIFNAQVWRPLRPYDWKSKRPSQDIDGLLVYEAHIGMAQDYEGIGTFTEFQNNILPRIIRSGYNTLQLMAIQEHPYYGSFGYHVSNFFALSSRFGTPDEFKALIDAAHQAGLRVIMDLVHSHAVKNETEGISRFDGTLFQYFHEGNRGDHLAWDSRCFDYGKPEVLHFLLSNCRFWLDEYRVDGFRFDGITSMLYLDHGLEKAFTTYDDYFDANVDEDALVYLAMANKVIHAVNPMNITIAEDISGMPGLASPENESGFGFDFRFAMGIPDNWIRLIKEIPDELWHLETLWFELNNRRHDEKTISYCESHDQALVGDQTIIFRLIGSEIYDHMHIDDTHYKVDRGLALHKLIRLITLATAGNGYLNFMGNEFGHPEWIDFPRQENGWTYKYALRQWHLLDNADLKYHQLARFDRDMIHLAKSHHLLGSKSAHLLHEHNDDKVLAFLRADLVFVFNFHPNHSHVGYPVQAPPGKYRMIFNSDMAVFGGHDRLEKNQIHFTKAHGSDHFQPHQLSLYLPTRTAVILKKQK